MRGVPIFFLTTLASASVLAGPVQLPEGGVPVRIIQEGTLCGPVAPGWSLEGDGQSVQPPPRLPEGASRQFGIRVAPSPDKCAESRTTIHLVATSRWPIIDAGEVTFFPGEGRLEIKGQHLKGLQVTWRRKIDGIEGHGVEWCLEPSASDRLEVCTIPVARDLPANSEFFWLPANADTAEDSVIFDDLGNQVSRERFRLHPARTVLPGRLHTQDGVDISKGPGLVPLHYPEAVAAVDCGRARCELTEKGVLVRSVQGPAEDVTMALRLAPRVFVMERGKLLTAVTLKLPLLSCPISIASGSPLRDVSASRMVIRMNAECGGDAGRLAWAISGEPASVERVVNAHKDVMVLLSTERITRDRITVTATRPGLDEVVIGSVTENTIQAPTPRVSLALEKYGRIDFIPTNRSAMVTVASAGEDARFVPVPLPGAYSITITNGHLLVRGDENASGFASLGFGYRVPSLPAELAETNLAVINEPVQRQVRQASVPAPFWVVNGSESGRLVEFLCADAAGKVHQVPPGKPWQVDRKARESCRVVIHRERLKTEDGLQEVVLDVDVRDANGQPRSETGLHERMVLRPHVDPKVFWVRGVDDFDRISVRLTHVVDEERYVLSPTTREGLPSVQWTAVITGGHLRLYATAAIPAGLFRVNEPSGELRLNFGVLSRLTWLDDLGKEGLLGLELGVVGLGLVTSRRIAGGDFPPTLATVLGVGIRVPLGSGAAVGVHAWLTYEFRESFSYAPDAMMPLAIEKASHFAVVFGPSISIGNVGTNL